VTIKILRLVLADFALWANRKRSGGRKRGNSGGVGIRPDKEKEDAQRWQHAMV